MAETTNQPTTGGATSTWTGWIAAAKEIVSAGVGVAKDVAGIKLTDAERKAINRQKAEPNWPMIGAVVGGSVLLVVVLVLVVSAVRRRRKS